MSLLSHVIHVSFHKTNLKKTLRETLKKNCVCVFLGYFAARLLFLNSYRSSMDFHLILYDSFLTVALRFMIFALLFRDSYKKRDI